LGGLNILLIKLRLYGEGESREAKIAELLNAAVELALSVPQHLHTGKVNASNEKR
jgi:hypothetical protein